MTSAMLFEGPDLEEVLAEAEACLGSTMIVEAANRVRHGGVLGFFAQERYEIWARAGDVVDPIAALLEEADLQDRQPMERDDSFGSMLRGALVADTGELGAFGAVEQRFFGDAPVVPSATTPAEPRWSDDEPQLATADVAATGDVIEPWPTAAAAAAAAASPAPAGGAAVIDDLAEEAETLETAAVSAAVAFEDAARGASVFEERTVAAPGLLWAMLDRLEGFAVAPVLPVAGPAVVAFVGPAEHACAVARSLGERTGAWGNDMVVMTRRDEIDTVAQWMLVRDPDELVRRSARWRQRHSVTPVIIDQAIDGGARQQTADLLTALAPEQVRLVSEAWRLPSEVGEFAARIGGVEALELVDTTEAVEPLAVLDIDIPVSSVEGREATPALLAAVWLERRRRG